jgi:hypothetical protein
MMERFSKLREQRRRAAEREGADGPREDRAQTEDPRSGGSD